MSFELKNLPSNFPKELTELIAGPEASVLSRLDTKESKGEYIALFLQALLENPFQNSDFLKKYGADAITLLESKGSELSENSCKIMSKVMDFFQIISAQKRQVLSDLRVWTPSFFERLPKEILLEIFQYLSGRNLFNIFLSCKKMAGFRAAVLKNNHKAIQEILNLYHWQPKLIEKLFPALFKDLQEHAPSLISLTRTHEKLYAGQLQNISSLFTNLQHLTLSNSTKLLASDYAVEFGSFKQLRSFHVIDSDYNGLRGSITPTRLEQIIKEFTKLEHLSLEHCSLNDTHMEVLAGNCKNLLSLDLADNNDISTVGYTKLFSNVKNLQSFIGNWCDNIDDEVLEALARYCPSIQALSLWHCSLLTDTGMNIIAQRYPNLKKLYIGPKTSSISGIGLKALTEGCRKLEHIDIEGVDSLEVAPYEILAKNCSTLKKIRVSHISDKELVSLISANPGLKKLALVYSKQVTDTTLASFSTHLSKITSLELDSLEVTDTTLFLIGTHCTHLSSLTLVLLNKVTDKGLKELSKITPQLQKLSLQYVSDSCSEDALIDLIKQSPNLVKLRLWGEVFSDKTFQAIAESCQDLRSIQLVYTHITDSGLIALLEGCKKLKRIDTEIWDVTPEGVGFVEQRFARIKMFAYG